MKLIYTFTENESPAVLSKLFWQYKIGHRIVNNHKRDELWLLDPAHLDLAGKVLTAYLKKTDQIEDPEQNEFITTVTTPSSFYQNIKAFCFSYPISCVLVLVSVLFSFLTSFGGNVHVTSWLYFLPVYVSDGALYAVSFSSAMEQHQYWRLVTPMFLHFSIMHLCFNLLWVWDVGRKVEQFVGSAFYIMGVLFIGITANCLQYFVMQSPLFGGMSGVVYGVIGFAWLLPRLMPSYPLLISQPLMIFMMVWLVLGYTDVLEFVGIGKIANTAHLAGLIAGLLLALVYGICKKRH